MDYDTFRSLLGEGIHTGLRKAADSPQSARAWRAIRDMPDGEWNRVVAFAADPIWTYFHDDPPAPVEAEVTS